jgi:hypothetical protein
MKIKMTLLAFMMLPMLTLCAQNGLKGKWEGTITLGGYEKKEGDKFEIVIDIKGKLVTGYTYIHKKNSEVIIRKFTGRIFEDRSFYLEELPDPQVNKNVESYSEGTLRKYQFVYTRSIFESSLEGHWQEIINDPFDKSRGRGRIYLRKADKSKA